VCAPALTHCHDDLTIRPKFKKFSRESEALEFIQAHGGPSAQSAASSSLATNLSGLRAPVTKEDSRSSSPPAHAVAEVLPAEYAELARNGWKFSKKQPHALVVYTDGSGLGNGKRGARAGLGVWWGDEAGPRGR
jgi:ribonuclease HI